MSHELTFFDFKRKFGLGHHDIQRITQCTLEESKEWTKGTPAPKHIIEMFNAISVVIDRIKTDNGIFTDVDAQHAAHIIEKLNKEIESLKETMREMGRKHGEDIVFLGKPEVYVFGESTIEHTDDDLKRVLP